MLRVMLNKLASLVRRRRLDAELDEEIRVHLQLATDEYIRQGLSLRDARRAAERGFGPVEHVRERHREARGVPWLETLGRDLRFAARALRRDRGFTTTAVITLAVAIGANTAIFSVVDAVLLRALPYPGAERIVTVGLDRPDGNRDQQTFSDVGYRLLREESQSFRELGAYSTTRFALTGIGEPMQASVGRMTISALSVLGVPAHRGRLPTVEEDAPGGPRVALLSHALWSARLGADPNGVGRVIELNDTLREVIGVMPPDFQFPSADTDVWIPMQLDPASQDVRSMGHYLIGRLRSGATYESAAEDVHPLIQGLSEGHPFEERLSSTLAGQANVVALKERMVGDSRRLLLVVMAAVSFLLLIALSNVASLNLVRAEGQLRQRVLRTVLGASRRRLAQHALSEGLLLAVAGGLAGSVLALAGTRALVGMAPASIPRLESVDMSGVVLAYTVGVSLVVGVVVGLLPGGGAKAVRGALQGLSIGARTGTAGRERLRLRGFLVSAQVALAVVLLIGSGLVVHTSQELRAVELGFETDDLTTFGLVLPSTRYDNAAAAQLYQELVDRLRVLPGVEAAAVTAGLPITPYGGNYRIQIEGQEGSDVFAVRWVTPGYFEAMKIPLVSGRTMLSEDSHIFRAFVSESFADTYWPNTSAIGHRVGPGGGLFAEVTGVVGDTHVRALDAPPEAVLYAPIGGPSAPSVLSVSAVVRTHGRHRDLVPLLRREMRALDPRLPLIDIKSMDEVVADSFIVSRTSFAMLLLVSAAVTALLLGAVGIYGVLAHVVSRRTSEIGIRMALGARALDIAPTVLRTSLLPAVAGVAVGLATAALGTRVLSSLLFETSPLDASTFIIGPVVCLAAAVLACVTPTLRAVRVNAVDALRAE